MPAPARRLLSRLKHTKATGRAFLDAIGASGYPRPS